MIDHTPSSPQLKQCTMCGAWKPATLEHFHANAHSPDGFRPRCKPCRQAEGKQYRKQYAEAIQARKKAYRLAHADLIQRASRSYYTRNRAKVTASVRSYRQRNIGRVRLRMAVTVHLRRAADRNLPATYTVAEWERCLAYFGHCCAVCGRPAGLWHVIGTDHWIPLVNPDCPGTVATNIVPLCHGAGGCNNSKSVFAPREWLEARYGPRKAAEILARIEAYFEWVNNQ